MPNESGGQKCTKHHEQLVHVQLLREFEIGGGRNVFYKLKTQDMNKCEVWLWCKVMYIKLMLNKLK
jgi:hypothetical protein